jgi:hypothetical protein
MLKSKLSFVISFYNERLFDSCTFFLSKKYFYIRNIH